MKGDVFKMIYQQGDIIIEMISNLPEGAIPKKPVGKKHILAKGEATGHLHAVTDPVDLYEKGDYYYISADYDFTVFHEEHNPVQIPKGIYVVRKVREYDHFAKELRWVVD